ncbi:hypothetical protein CY34DRAFT_807703 [Suillus luteus UH-Slu-Lm8-n1]|uniref:Uncharacterized protein n=1 Tax=Suillus luteus UH-Slu-Lm8-n1 TaxID=930992 RepID=A0A0D0B834_9AGAM|nr:hypothetical protein CY34DRAFT_807703 [Suillus luteus UH-Slu-Lm8-n1]
MEVFSQEASFPPPLPKTNDEEERLVVIPKMLDLVVELNNGSLCLVLTIVGIQFCWTNDLKRNT